MKRLCYIMSRAFCLIIPSIIVVSSISRYHFSLENYITLGLIVQFLAP